MLSARRDIDRPAFSIGEREAALPAEDHRLERESSEAPLELVDDLKPATRVGARSAKWIPVTSIVDKQFDHDSARRHRADPLARQPDRAFRARGARDDRQLDAGTDPLDDLRFGGIPGFC